MRFLTTTLRCLALGSSLLGASLVANAQVVTPTSGSATCQVSPTATGLSYTFSGGTFSHWGTKGDLEITSATNANPVTVRSTGYGRGQIIAYYSVGGCAPVPKEYEVNKVFTLTPSDTIVGPKCVLANTAYTWSIQPFISGPDDISAQIGIDTYTWAIQSVPGDTSPGTLPILPDPLTAPDSYSGDLSAIRLIMPAVTKPFILRVKVGSCNSFGPQIQVNPSPTQPVIFGPTCRERSDTSPFTLTINTQLGTVYTWNVPPSWNISPANATTGIVGTGSTLSVSVTPDTNGGDVSVKASNGIGCTEPIGKYTLVRKLDPTAQITAPACFTQGVNQTVTVSPVPSNTILVWSIPAGFSSGGQNGPVDIRTSAASISVQATGSAQGTISVKSEGVNCNSTVISKLLKVNGNNGCTYALSDLGCGTIRLRSISGTGCLPSGTTYTWSAAGNTTTSTTTNTYTFPSGVNGPVTVSISNTANCLSATATDSFTSSPADCGNRATGSIGKGQLSIFPNPVGDKLNVDLPLQSGEQAKLVLVDMAGRTLVRTTSKQPRASLDVRGVEEGVYLLRAELPSGKVLTQKVIVRHETGITR